MASTGVIAAVVSLPYLTWLSKKKFNKKAKGDATKAAKAAGAAAKAADKAIVEAEADTAALEAKLEALHAEAAAVEQQRQQGAHEAAQQAGSKSYRSHLGTGEARRVGTVRYGTYGTVRLY